MANRKIIVFKVGSESFGMDIEQVKEIISPRQIFKIPGTPEFIDGLINIRNKVYTLINLRKKFKLTYREYDENTKIIVVNLSIEEICILVDEVNEIVWIDDSAVDSTPEKIKEYNEKNVTGIVSFEDKSILMLDINQLIEKIGNL